MLGSGDNDETGGKSVLTIENKINVIFVLTLFTAQHIEYVGISFA